MTQQDVYNLLKKKDKWMTTKEIIKCLKLGRASVSVSLSKLFNQGEIFRKQIPLIKKRRRGYNPYLWKIK